MFTWDDDSIEVSPDTFNGEYLQLQEDEKFCNTLEAAVSTISSVLLAGGRITNKSMRGNKDIDTAIINIEEAIWERIGIPIRIIGSDMLAYTIPLSGPLPTAISPRKLDIVAYLESKRTKNCTGRCDFKDVDHTKINSDEEIKSEMEIVNYLGSAYKDMQEAYGDKRIKIDTKKIKIKGMEKLRAKNKRVLLGMSFVGMATMGMTVREIVSIILHEVGHTFNDIMFGTTFTMTCLPALSSFTNDKFSREEQVTLAYKDLTGKEATLSEAIKRFPIEYMLHMEKSLGKNSAFYNSEIMADTFAAKFGYAEDVVMALNKLQVSHERKEFPIVTMMAILFTVWLITIFILAFPLILLLTPEIIAVYLFLMPSILMPNIQDLDDPHEKSFARTRRMRLELIRQLRTKQARNVKPIVDAILRLGDWLDNNEVDKTTGQILFTLIRGNGEDVAFHELYQRLEQLSENDLHVLSIKLKQQRK